MKRVVVVGAGMGGLSAAIHLQHAGYDVTLYEKGAQPGGKMHRLEVDGHRFDVGPTLVMMPAVYREIFSMTGRDPEDYIPITKLSPMYDVMFDADPPRFYSLNNDMVDLHAMVEAKGPRNALGFYRYLNAIYERYQIALEHFITRPFRRKWDFYNPKTLWNALKLKTFDSADRMMASFLPDRDLQQMLSFQTLYIGVSPKKGPSLYNIIPMIELMYGVWFLKGGMFTMAEQMAKLFQELGGVIRYRTEVEEILVRDGKVRGLRIGGEEIASDYVICNADFPYAMTHLIRDERARGKYTPERIDRMEYSCSCLVFYWGVDGVYPDLAAHTFVVSDDLDLNLRSIFDGTRIEDPSVYLHIPSNVDPSLAPEGRSTFYVLIPLSELVTANYEWNEETLSHYRERALRSLEKLPGLAEIRSKIRCERYFTPVDYKEHFNAYRGATFGLQPTLTQSNHLRPQSKCMTCEGLYFAGSSIHPGAGVPIAIQSGKICAEELRRDVREDAFA